MFIDSLKHLIHEQLCLLGIRYNVFWCSTVKRLEHVVMSVCCFPLYCLFDSPDES